MMNTKNLKNRVYENKVLNYEERKYICDCLDLIDDFNKAQIITGGRLNGRTYAYKCGQQNMKVLMIKKIKEARTKIKNSIEPIVGTYNRETPERDWPSYKIQRNKGREDALEILDKLIEGMN